MKNSELYAYIERMFDAIHSGLPDGDIINETLDVLMDFEDEVHKQMQAEEDQKSGFDSTSFFERMDEVHPKLVEFMQYLMEEDDPTFFIAYGDKPKLTGRSSDKWGYETSLILFNYFLSNCRRSDSDDK